MYHFGNGIVNAKPKNVSNEIWADTIVTAVYLRKRLTCQILSPNTTPFRIVAQRETRHKSCKSVWCVLLVSRAQKSGWKTAGPGKPAMLMRYSQSQILYKVCNSTAVKFDFLGDVRFDKEEECLHSDHRSQVKK